MIVGELGVGYKNGQSGMISSMQRSVCLSWKVSDFELEVGLFCIKLRP